MKKYRYVELVDGVWGIHTKRGQLYVVSTTPERYIEELSMEMSGKQYFTTLEKMGELGWELAFVTPCGNFQSNSTMMLQNSYIFKKEID